ncbi:MAG: hypothetical protein KJ000_06005 [Pirellulaceae bacterium]|nr:hypothetical protein [Pirellulaceae bacterium]
MPQANPYHSRVGNLANCNDVATTRCRHQNISVTAMSEPEFAANLIGPSISKVAEKLDRIFTVFSDSDDTEHLTQSFKDYLQQTIPLSHASLWGKDEKQQRVFIATEFISDIGISDFQALNVHGYDESLLGESARTGKNFFLSAGDFSTSIRKESVRDYLQRQQVKTLAIINLYHHKHYPACLVLASREGVNELIRNTLVELRAVAAAFIAVYAQLRTRAFESQISRLIASKMSCEGLGYLKQVCDELKTTFEASSFSIWERRANQVIPTHFSEPHKQSSVKPYDLGEGLTGHVAKTGRPIFLHLLTDASKFYGAQWAAKVSDFHARSPQSGDHIIIVPLSFPQRPETPPTVSGVVRFVKRAETPSFWPIDFARATSVANILSVILYQERLLQIEASTSRIQQNLVNLACHTVPAGDMEDSVLAFVDTIERWPGVNAVSLVEIRENDTFAFDRCNLLKPEDLGLLRTRTPKDVKGPIEVSETLCLWPLRSEDRVYGLLAVRFETGEGTQARGWLDLATYLLNYVYRIGLLIDETARLRHDTEERQLASLAGTAARSYAHEVLNAVKAIRSWISNSRSGSPNYAALEQRVREIFDNVTSLLDATGFTKLNIRRCVFNVELDKFLGRLNYKHGRKLDGCELKLKIAGHKHRAVNFDPDTLIAILTNLVTNSKEQYLLHSRKGPIEIGIVEKQIGSALWVGVYVEDHAIGILPENMERIFHDGFTTKPDGKGIGLGMVKRLVEDCDGQVLASSDFVPTTRFEAIYPVAEEIRKGST